MKIIDFVDIKSNKILEKSEKIYEMRNLYGDPSGCLDKRLRELRWELHLMQLQEQENLEQYSCISQDSGRRVCLSPHESSSPITPPIFGQSI